MENCIDEFCFKEKKKFLLNLFLVSWRLRNLCVYVYSPTFKKCIMKNHQIEYIFPIPFPHRFFAQIQNSQNKHGEKFFSLCFILGIFLCAQKNEWKKGRRRRKKFGKIVCKYYAIYLSLSFELFVWFYLFCFCFFFLVFLLLIPGVPNIKNRFYYVSSMNTFHVDINRKQMSIEGGSGWRRMVREIGSMGYLRILVFFLCLGVWRFFVFFTAWNFCMISF